MTDDGNTDEREQSQDEPARVVRDASFVKIFADSVLVQNLGRDIDLCLIQFGLPLTHFASSDTEISFETSNCVTEAGRVRLAWPVAINTAMNIMHQGIEAGLIKGNKVIERLQQQVDEKKVEDEKIVGGDADGNEA